LSVKIAESACEGRHYTYICHKSQEIWDWKLDPNKIQW
jgi:hypothetical protein